MEEGECLLESMRWPTRRTGSCWMTGESEVKPPAAPGGSTVGGSGSDRGALNLNKTKNRKKKKNFTDVNRFALDVCRRLREKKSYMVYAAVGCLGISALNNLVNKVDVVQSCGGQMTTNGRRARTGSGVLWNIIKSREPMAYKEIMKNTKEFENQFKQQNRPAERSKEVVCQKDTSKSTEGTSLIIAHGSISVPQNANVQVTGEVKRTSIHDRLRVPVSYDDLLGE